MEDWKQRLREAREAKGLNKTAFAKAIGVSNATVTDWEKSFFDGGIKEISGPRLTKICEVLGVDPHWLLDGRASNAHTASAVPGARGVHEAGPDDPTVTQIAKVKIKVQAGITGFQVEAEHYDGETTGVPTDWVRRERYSVSDLLAIVVRGDSMETALHDGDVIVVNTADKKLVDGVVYAINYEGEVVVKRVQRDAGMWWLTSDNADKQKYHRKACKGAECIVIGRVVRKESTHI
ncbi:XRE family transcriptional regulator [Massilia oculi]|uniref:XRE family transcriptional regulator n=1 Tax=Massilia oculi TaxID=945844 RepID=UPI001E47435E|nr:LexA family transcriptional regulator [Massilia oculi]